MLIFIFFTLIASVVSQPSQITIITAIQIQDEYYFSYLPLIETCSYDSTNIIQGQVILLEIDETSIYERILEVGVLEFWAPVRNGLDIVVALDIQTTEFMGHILYNSPEKDRNRPIIFFNISKETSLTFYFTLVTINTQTLQLNLNITNQIQVQLSDQAQQLLMGCKNVNSSNFAYLGNGSFLFVCGQSAEGFIFDPWINEDISFIEFSTVTGDYRLAPNPSLTLDGDKIYTPYTPLWNSVLLITKQDQSTLFYYIGYKDQNFTMASFDGEIPAFQLIIDRLWGQQASVQFVRLMDLYTSLKLSQEIQFPGEIASVFVSKRQNIFVQSVSPSGLTYLCVFNSRGQIQWNISFSGQVVYFGNQITIIYDYQSGKFNKLQISRPIYVINPSDFQEQPIPSTFSQLNVTLPCQSVNITFNYRIYWSTIEYPSAFVQMLDQKPILSNDSTDAVQTLIKFLIIGPAIDIIPAPPEGLEVYIINYKTAVIHSKTVAVFSMEKHSDNIEGIMLVTSNSIFYITPRGKVITLVSQPCGFNSIMSAQLSAGSNYCTLVNSNGQVCLCQPNFMVCSLVTSAQSSSAKNSTHKITLSSNDISSIGDQNLLIKKTLFELIQRNLIVWILQNNTVIVYDLLNKKTITMIQQSCNAQNISNGVIFLKEFYSPSLFLFCEGSNNISQFVIKEGAFIFQRIISLSGFQTVSGSYSIQKTSTFVFLSVNPIVGPTQNCCVLRLNPQKPTASVITQVIIAEYLITTATYVNYDFVFVQKITENGPQTLINIYVPNEWISFNQTDNSQLVTSYPELLFYFSSPIYNFYSFLNISVTFNLSRADLKLVVKDEKTSTFFTQMNNKKENLDTYILSYNMSNFACGPIFNSYFQTSLSNILLEQTDTLVRLKLIGSQGINYIQFINPEKWNQANFTLNNLLFILSKDTMYVYSKILNSSQMILISNFSLPQKSCTYYIYEILNSTAASLTSNCNQIGVEFQTPLLTINYNLQNNVLTHSSTYMQIPITLRNLQTINVNSSFVLILGVLEGPAFSPSGRLMLCQQQNCSYLFVSSNLQFLLDYSSFLGANQSYFVMAIGALTLDVFVNPQPVIKTYINPNYTIFYAQQIDEPFCSVITILNANYTSSSIILSGSKYYYYIFINFITGELKVLQKYERYSQCNLFDEFTPDYIYENQTLLMFSTQCRQNGYKTQLDVFVGEKQNVIYTGYLQVFTNSGPRGPACSENSLSPIRIIPISTSMNYPLFTSYKLGNIYKFIYSSLDGYLIDNLVSIVPEIKIIFMPSQINFKFPDLQFYAYNQFHFEKKIIKTDEIINRPPQKIYFLYIAGAIFCLLNFVTLIFLFSYVYNKRYLKQAIPKLQQKPDSQYFQSQSQIQQYQNPSLHVENPSTPASKRLSQITTKSKPYELELHFIKKKPIKKIK